MTPEETIAAIRADARFATAKLAADHARMLEDCITLTQIPAPPFAEEERAAAYLAMLRAHGLEEVEQDEIGNVMGLRRGFGNGDILVVAAHLDTVFPAGTDVRVRREGTRLFAPGVSDDTWSLAVNLGFGLGETLAHLRRLQVMGEAVAEQDAVGVIRWRRA